MLVEHVRQCAFDSWYSQFSDITIESVVLDIEEDLYQSLISDGIMLPRSRFPKRASRNCYSDKTNSSSSDPDEERTAKVKQQPDFPEFESKLMETIHQLGGVVFPKLNWSCPKDAAWMLCGNSLKCRNFSDIYLLLKSSDFAAHDLYSPYLLCSDAPLPDEDSSSTVKFKPLLVLRRWTDIHPNGEFRCFVRGHKLVAISQRIYDAYFPSIIQDKDSIAQELCTFFQENIQNRFPLEEYTMDVYRESPGHVILIDFNVFGPPTEALLFSWDELEDINATLEDGLPVFKYQSDSSIRPSVFKQYQYPIEAVECLSLTESANIWKIFEAHFDRMN